MIVCSHRALALLMPDPCEVMPWGVERRWLECGWLLRAYYSLPLDGRLGWEFVSVAPPPGFGGLPPVDLGW